MNMISEERIKTNRLLIDELGMWDEFTVKSINDEWTLRYYNYIMNLLNSQVDEAINWLDSDDARELFFGEAKYQQELFRALEDEWDKILESKYPSVEALMDEVYRRGKAKGYADMREHIKFTDTDKLALNIVRDYNFHLIRKIDNDTREQIKNTITSAVLSGENPRKVAPKIMDTVGTRLEGSTFTPMQRATMIARTEISRAQNTGILQSYINEGYTEVKILTAEDSNVCYTCLTYAYEFNNDDEIIFQNRGEEKVHNIIELIKCGKFPPFHPLCRCTYLSIWKTKGEPPENPYIIDITPSNVNFYPMDIISQDPSKLKPLFERIYDGKVEGKPFYMDETEFKELIGEIVDSKDINKFSSLFYLFKKDLPQLEFEWGAMYTSYDSIVAFGKRNQVEVKIPQDLENDAIRNGALIIIHNHPITTSPFGSPEDFNIYARLGVKYGVSTNELGTFIVKNCKVNENKLRFDKVEAAVAKVKEEMIDDFSTDVRDISDKTEEELTDEDKKELNEYVNDHMERYNEKYQSALIDFDFEVKLINH